MEASPIDWTLLRSSVAPPAHLFGVGVDIEHVARFRHRGGLARLFTEAEQAYCESQGDPGESYTGTWCAKEAVVKALAGHAALSVRQVEIQRLESGRPVVSWTDPAGAAVGSLFRVEVSIAHSQGVVVAVACAADR